VEEAVRQAKRLEQTSRIATEIRQEAMTGNRTLAEVAGDRNLEYSEPGAFSRLAPAVQSAELTGAAFGLAPGEISPPVSSGGGVWLVQLLERMEADAAQFAAEVPGLRARELQTLRQLRVQEYLASLRSGARITDRRSELYRTDAQAEAMGTAPALF
jgi:hypothetical protein